MARQLQRIDCTVEFVTPAFLGNAFQKGQWRVPPFKALLRRWWRILRARELNYDWERLRREEGLLWGNAFLETTDLPEEMRKGRKNGHQRSAVDIRLSSWDDGSCDLPCWERKVRMGKVAPRPHKADQKVPVALYLGYGPVDQGSKKLAREREPAIAAQERQKLTLLLRPAAADDATVTRLKQTLQLLNMFGTLGSRASNGWGSIRLLDADLRVQEKLSVVRDWQDCLHEDWAHAIGKDDKPLLWRTETVGQWQHAMEDLAWVLANCRAKAKKFKGPGITGVFLMGYPVQGPHRINTLGNDSRWQAQLRFKVRRLSDGQFQGVVYHLPHSPPEPLWRRLDTGQQDWVRRNQVQIWRAVHEWLDNNLQR